MPIRRPISKPLACNASAYISATISDSGKSPEPTTIDFGLRISAPSGSELLQAAATHTVVSHTAAWTVARCTRGSILIPTTLMEETVSFCLGWDKDDTMSSDTPASPSQPQPKPAQPPEKGAKPAEPAIGFTRAGALWTALIAGFLILILLLIFITQNTASASFQFFTWHWSLPLGVAILLAAVAGGLLTVAVGTARIFQLRRAAKKHHAAASR